MKKTHIFLSLCLILFSLCSFALQYSQNSYTPIHETWVDKETKLLRTTGVQIDPKVLKVSLKAYNKAKQKGLTNKRFLTVIDYSKPSTEKRLWVFDLENGKTLFNTWVSHGRNSGGTYSTSFSNRPGSLKSSIGVFLTDNSYIGGNGYSLRLRGLERGINDNAYDRSVVVHGARYVNPDIIRRYGQIGRSWGCPAVSPTLSRSLINTIKGKSVLVAYYPDRNWLSHSKFLAS